MIPVLVVVLVVFLGIFAYLMSLEARIGKLLKKK